ARGAAHRAQVVEDALRLRLEIALDDLHRLGIEGNLPGEVHGIACAHGLRIGSYGGRGIGGGNGFHGKRYEVRGTRYEVVIWKCACVLPGLIEPASCQVRRILRSIASPATPATTQFRLLFRSALTARPVSLEQRRKIVSSPG